MFTINRFFKSGKLLLPILLVSLFSCSKAHNDNTLPAAITSFSFNQSANTIPVTSTASISGTNIYIFLPPKTNTNALVANFTLSDSSTVSVNGVAQQSGVTANNFTNPVTYTVTNQAGYTQSYTVTLTTDIASIDQNVTAFMTQYAVPGLSLAITLDDKLVYAKAYGVSDAANSIPASTTDLYRTVALSQQISSVAIMKLMDLGQINMTDKVFGTGAILGNTYGTLPYGPGITDITVSDLLHHTAGGWANDSTDPMFTNLSMSAAQLITWTLDNRPLTYTPGSHFVYSNFGYCILGRVIEKITGQSYADAVKSLALQPCGITDMQIAGNTLADRIPHEVIYYGQNNADPYDFNITRMDSHSGWLATATDMARFLAHVDGLSSLTIISPNAINVMTTPSTANPQYACGWFLDIPNQAWYHPGGLPGSGAQETISTKYGNFNFVVLTNTQNITSTFGHDMGQIVYNAISIPQPWPNYDLF
ncbi:MAG TPA: serine hydrolase [Ferruginibacter sp.]|nr:serine hydrolase [Ferruginibacter sp.]